MALRFTAILKSGSGLSCLQENQVLILNKACEAGTLWQLSSFEKSQRGNLICDILKITLTEND
jgi:hypothetical protein